MPLETEFGRKRAIDQSSCNKDFSCVKGFCPSFVTVHGGSLAQARSSGAENANRGEAEGSALGDAKSGARRRGRCALACPATRTLPAGPYGILVTGVGGTGVVTIGA